MSRRALVAVVVFAALLLVGVAWWGMTTTSTDETSPRTPTSSPPAAAPTRPVRDAPSKRSVPSEDADAPDMPRSGTSIGVGRGTRPPPQHRVLIVRTVDGVPIAGARVSARMEGRTPDRDAGVTDAAGRVDVVVDANERIVVAAEGFCPRSVRAGDDDVVVLKRPTQVEGTVVDAQGRPLFRASVSNGRAPAGRTSTDENGRFRLDVDPDAREVGLVVRHDEHFLEWRGSRHPGDLDVRVVLSRPGVVEGRVVLPDGLAPWHVEVDGMETGEDGAFVLDDLTAGEHELHAWSDDGGRSYRGDLTVRVRDGETVRGVRIVLRENPRSFAVLRVVGPDGSPVTFATARAQHEGGASTVGGGQVVVPVDGPPDREERVTLYRAASGAIEYGDLQLDVVTRATPDGEPLVVALPQLSRLEVNVALQETRLRPLPKSRVKLEQTGGPSLHVDPWGGDASPAVFRVAVGGSYRIRVGAEGFAPVIRDVTADELAAGRATVRLSAGATVRVRLVARPPARLSQPWFTLGFDAWHVYPKNGPRADGRYEIEHVLARRYEARFITCGGVVEKTLTIDVPEDGVLDLGDVVVAGTAPLKGRVVTPDGRPAGGAELVYFDARRVMDVDGVHAITRADGTFEFDVPVGATGDLCVSKTDLGGVMVPLDGKASWTELRLQPECRLRVVAHANSARGWQPSVALSRPDGTGLWCAPLDGEQRSRDGETVEIRRGLAPGRWVVRLYEETPPIEREVELVAGETTEVVLDEPK